MRILITAKGTKVVNEIEAMTNTAQSLNTITSTKRRNFTSSHYSTAKTNKKQSNRITNSSSFSTKRNSSLTKNKTFIDTDKGHLTSNELKQAKKIDLKVPKVLFPKNFVEKYENDSKTIAENVLKFFPDTSLNDLTSAIDRYKKNDTWPTTTTFTKESFDHLQNIVIEAGFLDKKVEYDKLIYIK